MWSTNYLGGPSLTFIPPDPDRSRIWSGPSHSRYTRLLFLPDAGTWCINSAEFHSFNIHFYNKTQQPKFFKKIQIQVLFPDPSVVTLAFCLFIVVFITQTYRCSHAWFCDSSKLQLSVSAALCCTQNTADRGWGMTEQNGSWTVLQRTGNQRNSSVKFTCQRRTLNLKCSLLEKGLKDVLSQHHVGGQINFPLTYFFSF